MATQEIAITFDNDEWSNFKILGKIRKKLPAHFTHLLNEKIRKSYTENSCWFSSR